MALQSKSYSGRIKSATTPKIIEQVHNIACKFDYP